MPIRWSWASHTFALPIVIDVVGPKAVLPNKPLTKSLLIGRWLVVIEWVATALFVDESSNRPQRAIVMPRELQVFLESLGTLYITNHLQTGNLLASQLVST